jgi:hypothetical protein
MRTAIGLLIGFALLVAIMRPGLPPTMAFTSRPPDCAPGTTGPNCVPWRPTPPPAEKEKPLQGVQSTPTEQEQYRPVAPYQWVTPILAFVCDKRPLTVCHDRVCYTRAQRCWQE